jgi:ubiquinone/menaquinone biosynthesis C-methylase UbiE
MSVKTLMDLWQRRGKTFGERSDLVKRNEAIEEVMTESLLHLQGIEGPVLDVGCGDGIPTGALIQHHRIIGVDFASTMLSRARSNLPSMDLLRASIDHLPLRSDSLPAITCYFVFSDYTDRHALLDEIRRVLCAYGRFVLADYSSNDDFNNLLDDLQKRVLGTGRGMLRLDPSALSLQVEEAGFKVRVSKEIPYRLRTRLDAFINQLYLSSVGVKYREKELREDQWRALLGEWVEGSEICVTRRFVLMLAEKP